MKERLTLVFLPPYSPNLNLVERIWNWLKDSVIANRFHPLRESIVSFLEYLSEFPEKVLQRICWKINLNLYRRPKRTF
ncbi:transposase [Bacillus alveayuensis]|uniref:transposase n=1 Tax=Aeribacillus alveayuensis TaxID=279215 RepID=UPI001F1C9A8C